MGDKYDVIKPCPNQKISSTEWKKSMYAPVR